MNSGRMFMEDVYSLNESTDAFIVFIFIKGIHMM